MNRIFAIQLAIHCSNHGPKIAKKILMLYCVNEQRCKHRVIMTIMWHCTDKLTLDEAN